jgi:hypothetical protein
MSAGKTLWVAVTAAVILTLSACSELSNREDFAGQLKDKTEPEVMKYAGKPKSVDSSDPNRVAWVYKARTFDVQSGRRDTETDVIFAPGSDGKLHVAEVVFK